MMKRLRYMPLDLTREREILLEFANFLAVTLTPPRFLINLYTYNPSHMGISCNVLYVLDKKREVYWIFTLVDSILWTEKAKDDFFRDMAGFFYGQADLVCLHKGRNGNCMATRSPNFLYINIDEFKEHFEGDIYLSLKYLLQKEKEKQQKEKEEGNDVI